MTNEKKLGLSLPQLSEKKKPNLGFSFGLGKSGSQTNNNTSPSNVSPEGSFKGSLNLGTSTSSIKKDQGVLDFSTLTLEEEEEEGEEELQLVIKSQFFKQSCKYWTQPSRYPAQFTAQFTAQSTAQTKNSENSSSATNEEEEEEDTNDCHWAEKKWREQRYEETISAVKRSLSITSERPSLKWDSQSAILNNSPSIPSSLLLHPFEPTVIVANHQQSTSKHSFTISVWDRNQEQKLSEFQNGQPTDSNSVIGNTTGMALLNEDQRSLLVTANDHAVVRVWSHYDDPDQRKLLSSFKAFVQGLVSGGKGAGLVINSLKTKGLLVSICSLMFIP